jgi:large subunit ribosomal protein L25
VDKVEMQASSRAVAGTKNNSLRRQGITPIHVYGKGLSSLSLQTDTAELLKALALAGRTTPISLSVGDKQHFTFVREIQRDPITGAILHVDLQQVPMTEVMRAQVPIRLIGDAPAVRIQKALITQYLHTLEVECLPLEIPDAIEADVSSLEEVDQALYVKDLGVDPRVRILSDIEVLVVKAQAARVAVEDGTAEETPSLAGSSAEDRPG